MSPTCARPPPSEDTVQRESQGLLILISQPGLFWLGRNGHTYWSTINNCLNGSNTLILARGNLRVVQVLTVTLRELISLQHSVLLSAFRWPHSHTQSLSLHPGSPTTLSRWVPWNVMALNAFRLARVTFSCLNPSEHPEDGTDNGLDVGSALWNCLD